MPEINEFLYTVALRKPSDITVFKDFIKHYDNDDDEYMTYTVVANIYFDLIRECKRLGIESKLGEQQPSTFDVKSWVEYLGNQFNDKDTTLEDVINASYRRSKLGAGYQFPQ